jgi:hypothetical protein
VPLLIPPHRSSRALSQLQFPSRTWLKNNEKKIDMPCAIKKRKLIVQKIYCANIRRFYFHCRRRMTTTSTVDDDDVDNDVYIKRSNAQRQYIVHTYQAAAVDI